MYLTLKWSFTAGDHLYRFYFMCVFFQQITSEFLLFPWCFNLQQPEKNLSIDIALYLCKAIRIGWTGQFCLMYDLLPSIILVIVSWTAMIKLFCDETFIIFFFCLSDINYIYSPRLVVGLILLSVAESRTHRLKRHLSQAIVICWTMTEQIDHNLFGLCVLDMHFYGKEICIVIFDQY